jgi:hypothetical protein
MEELLIQENNNQKIAPTRKDCFSLKVILHEVLVTQNTRMILQAEM